MTALPDTMDVIVVGSGAGGLAAALTARLNGLDVIVVEKAAEFGGTSALSGGVLWIPESGPATRAGISDNRDDMRTYLRHELGNHYDDAMIDCYLDTGPEMVRFFEDRTELAFEAVQLPDYHPDTPGAHPARSIRAKPYDGRKLGKDFARLRAPLPDMMLWNGMMIGGIDVWHLTNAFRNVRSFAYTGALVAGFARDRLTAKRGLRVTGGNALIARLLRSARDAGVRLEASTAAGALVTEGGRVTGLDLTRGAETIRVTTRRGVVLATGGFSRNAERVGQELPHHARGHTSLATEGNTGDGLTLAESVGAVLKSDLSQPTAYVPVSRVPRADGSMGVTPHLVDRGKPGMIAVTTNGRRFVNESNSYHDFVEALVEACPDGDVGCYMICDAKALRAYGMGAVKPWPFPIAKWLRNGYLIEGPTPEDLARKIGVDPKGLAETIARTNANAKTGTDTAFAKGGNSYNRAFGDPHHGPNPCLGPVAIAPFYAVRVLAGDLATFAGIPTDRDARVISGGQPVPGLYAVGNDAATIMGGTYPGAGLTLGPAMTFGYRAGLSLAEGGGT